MASSKPLERFHNSFSSPTRPPKFSICFRQFSLQRLREHPDKVADQQEKYFFRRLNALRTAFIAYSQRHRHNRKERVPQKRLPQRIQSVERPLTVERKEKKWGESGGQPVAEESCFSWGRVHERDWDKGEFNACNSWKDAPDADQTKSALQVNCKQQSNHAHETKDCAGATEGKVTDKAAEQKRIATEDAKWRILVELCL